MLKQKRVKNETYFNTVINACFGQSDYTITYSQVMESSDSSNQAAVDMMGETSVFLYMSGKKHRTEYLNSMASSTTIYNDDEKMSLALIRTVIDGNFYSLTHDSLGIVESELTVTETKETKEIVGYECVKYIVKDASGTESAVYATN